MASILTPQRLAFMLVGMASVCNQTFADKTFFGRYLAQEAVNTAVYHQLSPIAWPHQLPSTQECAERIKNARASQGHTALFLVGASTSDHQSTLKCTAYSCDYCRWADDKAYPQPADTSNMNLWDNYAAYADTAQKELGINSLRFSIEWALVEPVRGQYDQDAINHYAQRFVHLIERGITPVVCFHHYTNPCWFTDAGQFAHEKNIDDFVRFCTTIYRALMHALAQSGIKTNIQPLWATYNSPEGYAFKRGSELQGLTPENKKAILRELGTDLKTTRQLMKPAADGTLPADAYIAKKAGLKRTTIILKNMMEAHVRVYKSCNAVYRQDALINSVHEKPRIGFLKNIMQLDPAPGAKKALSWGACRAGDMLQNEGIYQFFTTGVFKCHIPTKVNIKHINSDAPLSLDFIGLNYYGNSFMELGTRVPEICKSRKTDNKNYRIYPQGLYRAIAEIHERLAQPVGFMQADGKPLPIFVTENGIATTDSEKRARFYNGYLYALTRAIEHGYGVHGYLTWTLADNYEWPQGDGKVFYYGLCSVDPSNPATISPKPGSEPFQQFARGFTQA